MVPYLSLLSAVATGVASVAAVASLFAVRTANKTAESANKTAQSLGDLERQRRHAELTPKFKFRIEGLSGTSKRMWVQLVGPSGLDRLDKLTVSIRNNIKDISANPNGRPTTEDVANQIWGPYRFQQDISGVATHGRSVVAPVSLLLGDDCAFILEETPTPFGYSGESASWPYRFLANRLTLLCERDGDEPWIVSVEGPDYLN